MDIIDTSEVKTRKTHNCWGCTKSFPKGTQMTTVVSVDCGDINRVYWCKRCDDYIKTLDPFDHEDGWLYGELEEYRRDYDE